MKTQNTFSVFDKKHYMRIYEIFKSLYDAEECRVSKQGMYKGSFLQWSGVYGTAFSRVFQEHFLFRSKPAILSDDVENTARTMEQFTRLRAFLGLHPDKGVTIAILYRFPLNIVRLLTSFPLAYLDAYFLNTSIDLKDNYPIMSNMSRGIHLFFKVLYLLTRTVLSPDHSYYQARRISPLLGLVSIAVTFVTQSMIASPVYSLLTVGGIGIVTACNSGAGHTLREGIKLVCKYACNKISLGYLSVPSQEILKPAKAFVNSSITGIANLFGNAMALLSYFGYAKHEVEKCTATPEPVSGFGTSSQHSSEINEERITSSSAESFENNREPINTPSTRTQIPFFSPKSQEKDDNMFTPVAQNDDNLDFSEDWLEDADAHSRSMR